MPKPRDIFSLDRDDLRRLLVLIVDEVVTFEHSRDVIKQQSARLFDGLNHGLATTGQQLYTLDTNQFYFIDHIGNDRQTAQRYFREKRQSVRNQRNQATQQFKNQLATELLRRLATLQTATPQVQPISQNAEEDVHHYPYPNWLNTSFWDHDRFSFDPILNRDVRGPYSKQYQLAQNQQNMISKYRNAGFFEKRRLRQEFLDIVGEAPSDNNAVYYPSFNLQYNRFVAEWNRGRMGKYRDWFAKPSDIRLKSDWFERFQQIPRHVPTLAELSEEITPHRLYNYGESIHDFLLQEYHQWHQDSRFRLSDAEQYDRSVPATSNFTEYYFASDNVTKIYAWYQLRDIYNRMLQEKKLLLTLLPKDYQQMPNRVQIYLLWISYLEQGRADSWKELINLYQSDQFHQQLLNSLALINANIVENTRTIVAEARQMRQTIQSQTKQVKQSIEDATDQTLLATAQLGQVMMSCTELINNEQRATREVVGEYVDQTARDIKQLGDALTESQYAQAAAVSAMQNNINQINNSLPACFRAW